MKTTTLLASSVAALGLMILPATADNATTKDKPAAESAVSQNTATVYIINVKGKGWGVAQKASLAIEAQDGVKKILLSGYRATVIMKDGKALDETKTKEAIVGKGLTMESFEKTKIAIPEKAYALVVTGTGWAITNDKARVALEKHEGILGAYVNRGVTIHLAKSGKLDKEAITKTLKSFKMNVKEIKPIEGKPF